MHAAHMNESDVTISPAAVAVRSLHAGPAVCSTCSGRYRARIDCIIALILLVKSRMLVCMHTYAVTFSDQLCNTAGPVFWSRAGSLVVTSRPPSALAHVEERALAMFQVMSPFSFIHVTIC